MTWNLQWRERADWRQRQERVAATLRAVRPDVLGLQEVWATAGTTLADLLVGDLNAPPETPEIRALTGELVDAWVAARGPGDPGHTLSRANPIAPRAAWQIDRRIDYVLARPGTPRRPVVVERAFLAGQQPLDGLHPSDHYAVVADLRAELRRSRAAGAPGGRRRGA